MIPKYEGCRDIAPRDDSRDCAKCQHFATLGLMATLNFSLDRMTIASQSDLEIPDVLTTALTHVVNPRDYLIGFLVHQEIKQMRLFCRHCFSYNFTEQARPDLYRGS